MDYDVIKDMFDKFNDIDLVVNGAVISLKDISSARELDHNIWLVYYENGFSCITVVGSAISAMITGAAIE